MVDAPDSGTPTTLDYELYGVSPIAQAGSDPGAYEVFNGALGKFDDALNIELYALENGGAIDPNAVLRMSRHVAKVYIVNAADAGTLGARDRR